MVENYVLLEYKYVYVFVISCNVVMSRKTNWIEFAAYTYDYYSAQSL